MKDISRKDDQVRKEFLLRGANREIGVPRAKDNVTPVRPSYRT